jgi:hypothetical protein
MLNAPDAFESQNIPQNEAEPPASTEIGDADERTTSWRDNKIQELEFIGLTVFTPFDILHILLPLFEFKDLRLTYYQSALIASLVGAALSWPSLATGPWSTKACWQASLMLIIAAITIAAQQAISLYRYSSSRDGLKTIRRILRGSAQTINKNGKTEIVPQWYLVYVWQLPAMLLRAGIICFIIGTTALLWDAARGTGDGWSSDDVKVGLVHLK